jgi:fucose 4-O-acetylase-like acetyltransferase
METDKINIRGAAPDLSLPIPAPARDQTMDALRGFAILLVVLGHMTQFTDPDFDHNLVFRMIYSFHMPLFFFISGYVINLPRLQSGLGNYVWKRTLRLAVPFLTWTFLVIYWLDGIFTRMTFRAFAIQIYHSPDGGGLWFLWALFLCLLILPVFRPVMDLRAKYLPGAIGLFADVTILAAVICLLRVWHFDDAGIGFFRPDFPYVLAGAMVRRWEFKARSLGCWQEVILVLFPFVSAGWYRGSPPWLVRIVQHLDGGSYPGWVTPTFDYVAAFVGISFSFLLFRRITWRPALAFFGWLGLQSLGIYAITSSYDICYTNSMLPLVLTIWVLVCTAANLVFALSIIYAVLRPSRIMSFLFLGEIRRAGAASGKNMPVSGWAR